MASHTVAIFVARAQFENAPTYYTDDVEIIDQDDQHILAMITYDGDDKYEHPYFVGDKISNYTDMWNLWIDRSGTAYYVPWWGHSLTAMLMWGTTPDQLEQDGWIHISNSRIANYRDPKVNDRQYDTLSLYCEHNHRDMFTNVF